MQGLKFFVAALAIFAVGCEASRFRRSPEAFDIRLIVETARDLSNTFFKHLNAGLDEAHPNVEKLLNEMAPEAGNKLREDIKELRGILKEEETRFSVIFATLVKALDDMKPIKACADKYAKDAKKLANDVEMQLFEFGKVLRTKYEKTFANIENGVDKIVTKARTLFDTEVPAMVKCLTPGNKEATKCLNSEIDKTLKGVTEIVTDIVFLSTSSEQALKPVIEEVIAKAAEILLKVVGEGKPIINKISDCVATM